MRIPSNAFQNYAAIISYVTIERNVVDNRVFISVILPRSKIDVRF
jgi:hypothetical protein